MPVQKIDPKVIFASNAPAIDKPPVFGDKTKGWDVSRVNNGRPKIPQMNKIQQDTDLKILWLNENAVLPYDASIDYPDGVVVLKDGEFQKKTSGGWVSFNKSKPYILEYYKTGEAYPLNARIMLANGEIAQSIIDGNTNDPNVTATGWVIGIPASSVKDKNGLTQQEINSISTSVSNIEELKKLKANNGDIVKTIGHTIIGLGGGVYFFEGLSTKTDNNGSWIASSASAGTWVLISNLYFESFGVVNDGTDQSAKMQKCIDFADSQKILKYGFEKANTYCLANPIVFKPLKNSDIKTFYDTSVELNVIMNGAKLKIISETVAIKVHRERTTISEINAFSDSMIDSKVLRLGLGPDDVEYGSEYRRSSSFFKCGSILATNIKDGIQFCPSKSVGGFTYSNYYHNFYNISYRNVTHGMVFDIAQDGENQTTRTVIHKYSHNGGACAVVGLNLETVDFLSFSAENLKDNSVDYPASSQRAFYIPKRGPSMNMNNHTITALGSTEDVPKPLYCLADNCQLSIYSPESSGSSDDFVGFFNTGDTTGSMPVCRNLNDFIFPYFSSRSAAVSVSGSAAISLPDGYSEAYGNIEYLASSSSISVEAIQVLTLRYPVLSKWMRTVTSGVFGLWVRIDKSDSITVANLPNDTNANSIMNTTREEITKSVSYSSSGGDAANSPTGGEFYGSIKWIPTISDNGVQIAYGTYPDVIKKRNYTGTWSPWLSVSIV